MERDFVHRTSRSAGRMVRRSNNPDALMKAEVLRLGFATAALREKPRRGDIFVVQNVKTDSSSVRSGIYRPDGAWGFFVGGVSTKISLLTELGRNRVAVGNVGGTLTQGSACRATLGFGTESRWDSQTRVFQGDFGKGKLSASSKNPCEFKLVQAGERRSPPNL